ncbi:MAG: hypothetical protein ABIG84_00470 [archaeon]
MELTSKNILQTYDDILTECCKEDKGTIGQILNQLLTKYGNEIHYMQIKPSLAKDFYGNIEIETGFLSDKKISIYYAQKNALEGRCIPIVSIEKTDKKLYEQTQEILEKLGLFEPVTDEEGL